MSKAKRGREDGGGGGSKPLTRSSATVFDFNTEFPQMKTFNPSDKLPDYRSDEGPAGGPGKRCHS